MIPVNIYHTCFCDNLTPLFTNLFATTDIIHRTPGIIHRDSVADGGTANNVPKLAGPACISNTFCKTGIPPWRKIISL